MGKPVIDLSQCKRCMVCVSVAPHVFRDVDGICVELIEKSNYPHQEVDEARKYCPADCIK